jgi:hypothetical protein
MDIKKAIILLVVVGGTALSCSKGPMIFKVYAMNILIMRAVCKVLGLTLLL